MRNRDVRTDEERTAGTATRPPYGRMTAVGLLIAVSVPLARLTPSALVIVILALAAAIVWFLGTSAEHCDGSAFADDREVATAPDALNTSQCAPDVAGTIWAGSLMVSAVAVSVLGLQLACPAMTDSGVGACSAVCAAVRSANGRGPVDADVRDDIADINAAVIGSMYQPVVSPDHPRGLVLLEARTTDGRSYMRDTAELRRFVQAAARGSADGILRAYRNANAVPRSLERARRQFADQLLLDSVGVERYLATPHGAGMEVPVFNADRTPSVPSAASGAGVLALSAPGFDTTRTWALVFAALRTPQALESDHVARAVVMLLRRAGPTWRVWREAPVRRVLR